MTLTNPTLHPSRKGQTLLEFALTLPILLMLMFGIIEFGRLFQAWVSIQNSARAAARYAATNQYNPRYDSMIDFSGNPDPDGVIPCSDQDRRGRVTSVGASSSGGSEQVKVFNGDSSSDTGSWDVTNSERIFATWYQGKDCDPRNQTDQELRRDILRIASVYEEAVRATIGRTDIPALSVRLTEEISSEQKLYNFLSSTWNPSYPQYDPTDFGSAVPTNDADLTGYFSVMMCSNRSFLDDRSEPIYNASAFANQRFIPVVDPDNADPSIPTELVDIVRNTPNMMPGCFLNERPVGLGTEDDDYTVNPGVRWLDPGSGGSRVVVTVTFYHPLITPLGLAPYIPIQARRAAIVEDFKGSSAAVALTGAGQLLGPGTGGNNEELLEPTDTPTQTPTATNTPLPPTLTPSPTPFDREFACELVTFADVDYDTALTGNDRKIAFQPSEVVMRIVNDNNTDALIQAAELNWSSIDYLSRVTTNPTNPGDPIPEYPGMYFDRFELGGETMWQGTDYEPSTDTATDAGAITSQVFTVAGADSSLFVASYTNGPNLLNEVLPRSAFTGTSFKIINPLDNTECPNLLTFTSTSDTTELESETDPTDPNLNCVSNSVTFDLAPNPFQEFGIVQLQLFNQRDTPAPLTDFAITWGLWEDRAEAGSVALEGIYIGGNSAQTGVQIWSAPSSGPVGITLVNDNGGFTNQDTPNDYTFVRRSDGIWLLNTDSYLIPAGASRNLWLDFTGDNLSGSRNFSRSDLFRTELTIGCGSNSQGTGGGTGGSSDGTVSLDREPTPEPTLDPSNDPPKANNDTYNLSGNGTTHSVGAAQGVLVNDTDCADTTENRMNKLTPCSSNTNPAQFNQNGDSPVNVRSCRNGCETERGAWIDFNSDGSFTYDPTRSDFLFCEAQGTLQDTYNYQIQDGRGARSTARVTINLTITQPSNSEPEERYPSGSRQTFYYDMRTQSSGSIGTPSEMNLKNLFTDPDGDSFSLVDIDPSFNTSRWGSFTSDANGNWSFNPWTGSDAVDLQSGQTKELWVDVEASDNRTGFSQCDNGTTKFRIIITGAASAPPPPPEDTPVPSGTDQPPPDVIIE